MNYYHVLRLYTLLILFGLISLIELVVNQLSHSLTVLTDCYHNLYLFVLLLFLLMSHKVFVSLNLTKTLPDQDKLSVSSFKVTCKLEPHTKLATIRQTFYGKSLRATFGWARIEVLGTLVNIIFIIALCFSAIVEGIQILIHSSHRNIEPTNPELLLICGALSLIVNLIKCFIIGELIRDKSCYLAIQGRDVHVNCIANNGLTHSRGNVLFQKDCSRIDIELNESMKLENSKESYSLQPVKPHRSHFIDIIRNSATSTFLIITACIILLLNVDWTYLVDPIVGMFSVVIILTSIYPSMKESGLILLQTVPKNINVNCLKRSLYQKFPSIINIHDLHIWCLTSDKIIATFHITLSLSSTHDYIKLNLEMRHFLFCKGISLATIQPEFQDLNEQSSVIKCRYTCSSTKERCDKKTCCHQSDKKIDLID